MRVVSPESMHAAPDHVVRINLADLARINRWLGGHWTLARAFRSLRPPDRFTVLDAGAASGDNGRAIRALYPGARVTSLDVLARNLRDAESPKLVADAFALPFGDGAFDYVFCSLLLHHFSDEDVVRLLAEFARVAGRGIVATDLERHAVARAFLPATRWLFDWHPLTVSDGVLSVGNAFRPKELEHLARRAGLDGARVRRHRPWFRLSLVSG